MATPKPHAPGELDEELERDEENDSAEMRELLRKVAAAPSIDPSTLTALPPTAIQGFEPGEKLGHFRILERIGAGGMGVVYRAEDERLRRKVALKVLPPHQVFDRERRKRLWREAQSAAAVNHPNIAAIYELGEAEGAVFIAMEFLDGQPLRRHLSKKPLPLGEVLAVATQIAQGLARAHDAGIVHRDLKPDNVMVLPDRTVKILDFGLAKLLAGPEERVPPTPASGSGSGTGSTATKDGQVVGTPKYMSPEQKRGADVDARSDLYSFGVLLAELLCGKWPETADRNLVGIFRAALAHHGTMDLEQRTLLEQLAGVAAHCLAEDPVDRFPTAQDLLASLRTVALVSGAETARGRAHRVSGGWVLGVSVVVALAIAGGIWWERRPSLAQPASATAQRMTERRLTANPPDNPVLDAALSPDGRTLAYVDRAGLFLRGLDPVWTEQVRLTERGPLQSVAWFPDGQELLVTIGKGGDEGTQLWRVRRDGVAKRIDAGYYERPRVSSTGRLAWIEPKGIAIGSVDAPRAEARVVVKLGPGEEVDQLTWSPDGTRIAFVRIVRAASSGLTARIETLSASGGGTQAVLESNRLIQESGDAAMTWAADGRILYALAELPPRETGFTLWSVPIDRYTGRPLQPPQPLHGWTGSTPGLLTTSRDGAIAYARTETQSDVYIAELADGGRRLSSPRRLTMTDHNERPASWTPDSKSVLLTSDQNGSNDLFAQDVGSGLLRPLLGTRAEETWPTQLPDGQLLFWQHPHTDGEQSPHPAELRRAELGGTASTPVLTTTFACDHTGADLPPHNARYRCPARGPCLLGELDGTEWIFSTFQPANGARQERLRVKNPGRGAVGWDLSRDGTKLAIPGAIGQVKIVDVATGKSVDRFVDQGCSLEHAAWAPDGNGLFVTGVCVGDRPFKLYFTELYRSAQLLWDSSSKWFGVPVVSPDARQIAFAVRPYDNDVWLARGL